MLKKPQMGRPRTDTEAVNLRLPREMIEAIDALRKLEDDLPTRPEMIRRVLAQFIESARQ